jgi:hypothetical protein
LRGAYRRHHLLLRGRPVSTTEQHARTPFDESQPRTLRRTPID